MSTLNLERHWLTPTIQREFDEIDRARAEDAKDRFEAEALAHGRNAPPPMSSWEIARLENEELSWGEYQELSAKAEAWRKWEEALG